MWIAALCRALKSTVPGIRSRAVDILADNFKNPGTDPSFREAWRKAVSPLAEAIKSDDDKVRSAVLAMLGMLGPQAGDALVALKALARDSREGTVRSAALEAIKSITSVDDLKAKDPSVRDCRRSRPSAGWAGAHFRPFRT